MSPHLMLSLSLSLLFSLSVSLSVCLLGDACVFGGVVVFFVAAAQRDS